MIQLDLKNLNRFEKFKLKIKFEPQQLRDYQLCTTLIGSFYLLRRDLCGFQIYHLENLFPRMSFSSEANNIVPRA